MKRFLIFVLLANLILTACASAPTATPEPTGIPLSAATALPTNTPISTSAPTAAPSATALPTSTPTPTATSTVTPIPTPTPIPTLPPDLISGLQGVPDPRYSNPELFDLRNSDAPIPQFVAAMKMAKIEISAEQTAQAISYQALKDIGGKPFVVAAYDVDPDPSQKGEVLEGSIPLLIGKQETTHWTWREAMLKELAEPLDFLIGTAVGGYGFADYYEQMVRTQTRGDFNLGMEFMGPQWNEGNTDPYPAPIFYKHLDSDVRIQQKAGMAGFGHLLVWGSVVPTWLRDGSYTPEEVSAILQRSIESDVTRYKGSVRFWNPVNEFGFNDFFLEKIGSEYLETAFRTVRETDPSGILVYNDHSNHTAGGARTLQTKQIVDSLRTKDLVDMVGLETILFYPDIPTKEQLIEGMQSYEIPVVITEFNVNMGGFSGSESESLKIQAKAYHDTVSACLESGVCEAFIMIYVSDAANFWNTQESLPGWSPQNNPSPFDSLFRPKPCYYAARMAFLDYTRSIQK